MKKKPQDLNEILECLEAASKLRKDHINYNLNDIPFEEWNDYENAHLLVPEECPKHSVIEACSWLEEYYGFKEKQFSAYITSDHHGSDWHHDIDKPSGFYFEMGDTSEEDNLAKEIYAKWIKEGKADRPGFEKRDAGIKASTTLAQDFLTKLKDEIDQEDI